MSAAELARVSKPGAGSGMKNIIIQTPDGEPRICTKDAVIDGGHVLSGFTVVTSAILN